MTRIRLLLVGLIAPVLGCMGPPRTSGPLAVATFQVDATPPPGSSLCDGLCIPAKKIVDPLSARGIVLLHAGPPIVVCVLDWTGIGNGGYDTWRQALAGAAGTTPDRVAIHCIHQHDAPGCDFDAEKLLAARGLGGSEFDVAFARRTIRSVQTAIRRSLANPTPVTHVGLGQATVEKVGAARRILGPDGKVKYTRWSSCKEPAVQAAPEGVIDPKLRLISLWSDDRPIVSMTYYATHPMSFYGRGAVSADFVGLARGLREATLPDVFHMHFNGAGGNITAGKYNDGLPARRLELAGRLAQAMAAAWDSVRKYPITAEDVSWKVCPVRLPPSPLLVEAERLRVLDDPKESPRRRVAAARDLVWLRRCHDGVPIDITCLKLGPAHVLHMPGELFVEYQLAAQAMRPDDFVCMAAYGDYGPGYIGTAIAYEQGGYETGPASRVGPGSEAVLLSAVRELLR